MSLKPETDLSTVLQAHATKKGSFLLTLFGEDVDDAEYKRLRARRESLDEVEYLLAVSDALDRYLDHLENDALDLGRRVNVDLGET